MYKKKNLLCSISITTCLALNAMASDKPSEDLGSVAVIDSTFEAHIKSITSEKLENLQASDIKDILKSMPSVIVDGNARYSQKVYVRGLEDKSSNITIDGARISGQLFHHSGDQTIDAETLKISSIELGPNSALSGPGVINASFKYETKDPSDFLAEDETFGGKVSTGYQSALDRKSYDVAIFSKINDKLEFVGIGNVSKDGKIEIPGKEDIKTKKSELKSGLIKFVIKPNDKNTIKLAYNRYEDGGNRQFAAEKAGNTASNTPRYNEIVRDTLTLNYNYNPSSDLINFDAKVFSNKQELSDSESTYTSGGNTYLYPAVDYTNEAKGFDLRNRSIFSNHMITYGIDYSKEEQGKEAAGQEVVTAGPNVGNTNDITITNPGEITAYGAYIEDEIDLDRLILNIGARYDVHKMSGVYDADLKGLSPKFKASYQASDNLKLRAGYGRIFKGPMLPETVTLSNSTVQNANVDAQKGHNVEVGFDYDLTEVFNTDDSMFGFTAYRYNVDGYMHPTKNNSIRNQYDQVIYGVESMFKYTSGKTSFSLSHTYTGGDAQSISTGKKFDPVATQIHTFKIDTDYRYSNNLSFNYNAEFVPGNKLHTYWENQSTGTGTTYENRTDRKGYGVHNLSASYKLSQLKGAKILVGVDNIFDKKYVRHTAFGQDWADLANTAYETGRNIKVKFTYKF